LIHVRTHEGERWLELEDFEAEVEAGRILPSTPVRLPVLTGSRWVSARELELFRQLHAPVRSRFARSFSLGRFPVVTTVLCLAQVIAYVVLSDGARVPSLDNLIEAGAKVGANVLELGETWRLLTANLLHRDVIHLTFNTFFLFNVGGTVENAYREGDFLLIVVVSALGTTTLSLLMSSVPSVGASGVVLGLFGAASVFGYKYGSLLPRRYRRYFGGAVLPYALFILYVGLASPDTDNWGHLGGILSGAAVTAVLAPRLLHARRPAPSRGWAAAGLAAGLATLVVALGPLVRAIGPRLERFVDERTGIAVSRPARWTAGENHLGDPAWGNRLGVSLGIRAERRSARPYALEGLRSAFLEELRGLERAGEITRVEVESERPFLVKGGEGLELAIALESRAGPQRTRNLLIARGFFAYRVVLGAPRRWAEAYRPLFDDLAARVALVETADLERARRVAAVFPGMSSAQVELGAELARVGRTRAAVRAYQRALSTVPDLPDALFGLARLSLAYGGDLEAAERAAAELLEDRPDVVPVVTLVADLRRRLGRHEDACRALRGAMNRAVEAPPAIRERLEALRCTGGW
jgi:membrane associated rhomboid family serine protease/tetratricopeptide (TPR) repeat protein